MLTQVFQNLLSNALKYAHSQITIEAFVHNFHIQFCIKDDGRGIAKQDLPKLFNTFFQVERAQAKKEGVGLGLAITKNIVELHRGSIWVESEEGQGSSFYFSLPYLLPETSQ